MLKTTLQMLFKTFGESVMSRSTVNCHDNFIYKTNYKDNYQLRAAKIQYYFICFVILSVL